MGCKKLGTWAAFVMVATLSVGCCKGKGAGTGPSRQASTERDVSREDLYKEIKRISDGENVGAELAVPSIVVDKEGVSVNGTIVSDAVLPRGTPAPVTALRTWLRSDFEHWRMLYPGRPFKGTATVNIDPSVNVVAGLSTVHTISLAGFAQEVTVGNTRFSAAALENGLSASAWLVRRSASGVALRFDGHSNLPLAEMALKDEADLRQKMSEVCAAAEAPCIETLVVDPGTEGDFGALALWMAAALDASAKGKTKLTIVAASGGKVLLPVGLLTNSQRDASPWGRDEVLSPRPNCDASKFKSTVRIGAVLSTGVLDVPKITAAVEAQMGELSTCFNTARCGNESLMGRVSVRFTILSNGQTTRLQNAGSDLPDVQAVTCVMDVFHKAGFPSGEGTTLASVPLLFTPR